MSVFRDPRCDRNKEHSLVCILYITLAAVVSGAESWYEVEEFGHLKKDFFPSRIKDFRGVPSHDTFNRLFSLLDPVNLERCFRVWVSQICGKYSGIVPIDGKTIRGSAYDNGEGSFSQLHVVSAWAADNGITLGQEKVWDKSNEITAIPALIRALDLQDCLITIDAMGCQKKIVQEIIAKQADYVICLKENQKKLHQQVQCYFREFDVKGCHPSRYASYQTEESAHGRYERRLYEVYSNGLDLVFDGWKGLKSVVRVTSKRKLIKSGEESCQQRYYITSLGLEAQGIAQGIRTHWSIENNLHWQLDVTFNEDQSESKKKSRRMGQ